MITSEIKFSQMEERMDADFFRPEFMATIDVLEKVKPVLLDEKLDYITDGTHVTPLYVKKGIKFLSSSNVDNLWVDFTEAKYITKKEHASLKHCQPKPRDTLISKSGRIGNAGVVPEDINEEFNIYEGLAILRVTKDLNPYYVAVFLESRFGHVQIDRSTKGVSQPHLHLEEIRRIKIPIPSPSFQSHIESLVKTAYEKRKEAQKKLQEAEEILEKELGWRELELNHDRAFATSFSHLERRFDPEYFKPRYERIKEVLLSKGAKPLSEAVKLITKKADFRKTPDKIIKYVAIADIVPESSQIVSHTEMLSYQAPSRATYEIKEGQVLTAVSGISRDPKKQVACYVSKKQNGYICTNGFAVLEPKEKTDPFYLLFYLKSPFYTEQIVRELTGSTIPAISFEDLKQVFVYLPSIKIQKEIAKLVEASNQLRTESRDLIEQAKKEVEEMIEKGNEL